QHQTRLVEQSTTHTRHSGCAAACNGAALIRNLATGTVSPRRSRMCGAPLARCTAHGMTGARGAQHQTRLVEQSTTHTRHSGCAGACHGAARSRNLAPGTVSPTRQLPYLPRTAGALPRARHDARPVRSTKLD